MRNCILYTRTNEKIKSLTTLPPVSGPTPSMLSNSAALTTVVALRPEVLAGAKALALAVRARKATAVFMVKGCERHLGRQAS